jgi:hypothetical protein
MSLGFSRAYGIPFEAAGQSTMTRAAAATYERNFGIHCEAARIITAGARTADHNYPFIL